MTGPSRSRSEVFPLIKTGGLADVAGALPLALAGAGRRDDARCCPGYPQVLGALEKDEACASTPTCFGGKARCLRRASPGLDLLVLDAPHLFDRPGGPYGDATGADWPDNWRRFAALVPGRRRHRRRAPSPATRPTSCMRMTGRRR